MRMTGDLSDQRAYNAPKENIKNSNSGNIPLPFPSFENVFHHNGYHLNKKSTDYCSENRLNEKKERISRFFSKPNDQS